MYYNVPFPIKFQKFQTRSSEIGVDGAWNKKSSLMFDRERENFPRLVRKKFHVRERIERRRRRTTTKNLAARRVFGKHNERKKKRKRV